MSNNLHHHEGLYSRNNLFEEMKASEYNLGVNSTSGEWDLTKPKSLWSIFLEAIQRNPKLLQLKAMIRRADIERHSSNQVEKKKNLESFLKAKSLYSGVSSGTGPDGEPTENDDEDMDMLLNDNERVQNLKKFFESKGTDNATYFMK